MKSIRRKSLLYKSGVEYADYSINHVEGCAHGCQYPCYAMLLAKRFGKIKKNSDWIKPKIVQNALELLDKEIPKYKHDIKFVHLSFMTDPFMFRHKDVSNLSLKIIEKLNKNGIKCTTLTKGIYPEELIDAKKYSNINEYGITLVSLDEEFRKTFEPNSAPFQKRIDALKFLHKKGLRTWVSMEPYPTPNLVKQDLLQILKKIAFVDKIVFGKLNYNVQSSRFENNKEFYEECANIVINFCMDSGIAHHIKYGTKIRDNKKTVVIFRNSGNSSKVVDKPLMCS
ncbi:MAG: radical SAM protein [Candidatus Aenigmarchaeota archaeon]|nr:radical SAM protein [Candidatus Aenigmarchaeota archaeon]